MQNKCFNCFTSFRQLNLFGTNVLLFVPQGCLRSIACIGLDISHFQNDWSLNLNFIATFVSNPSFLDKLAALFKILYMHHSFMHFQIADFGREDSTEYCPNDQQGKTADKRKQ